MKTSIFFVLAVLTAGSFADTGPIRLADGDIVGIDEVERVHYFEEGGIDYLELFGGDIVEGTDIENPSALSKAGGIGSVGPHEGSTLARGIGGKGNLRSTEEAETLRAESSSGGIGSVGPQEDSALVQGIGGKGNLRPTEEAGTFHAEARSGGIGSLL